MSAGFAQDARRGHYLKATGDLALQAVSLAELPAKGAAWALRGTSKLAGRALARAGAGTIGAVNEAAHGAGWLSKGKAALTAVKQSQTVASGVKVCSHTYQTCKGVYAHQSQLDGLLKNYD